MTPKSNCCNAEIINLIETGPYINICGECRQPCTEKPCDPALSELLSPCHNAPYKVMGKTTQYYACSVCEEPKIDMPEKKGHPGRWIMDDYYSNDKWGGKKISDVQEYIRELEAELIAFKSA